MTSRYNLSKTRAGSQATSEASVGEDTSPIKATGKTASSSTLCSTTYDRAVVLEDDELAAMAMSTKHGIDWRNVMLSARVGPARWVRQDVPGDFSVHTRHEAHHFDVLAVGVVPGCVAEILNVLQSHNSEQYAQQMQGIFESQFREGQILHHADAVNAGSVNKTDSTDLVDLTVKRVVFNKVSWLANHEEWCYVDAVHRSQHNLFVEKFMTTMQPKDLLVDASASNGSSMNAFHDVVCGYLLQAGAEDPPAQSYQDGEDYQEVTPEIPQRAPRETRVRFYAEYNIPKQVAFSLAVTKGWRRSVLATDKTIKQRLLKFAQSTSRLTALVRRQRLGLQALVDKARFLPPTNVPCRVCTRIQLVAKQCRVCGQGVCGVCSDKHERARQLGTGQALAVTRIRVCAFCLERVDQSVYENLTSSSILGAHVLPDTTPAKDKLKELLQEALLTAPSPTRKASVKSVIKCVLDQEATSQQSRNSGNASLLSTTTSPMLTPTSSDNDYFLALDGLEIDDVALRSDDHRCYQLDTSGSTAVPVPIPDDEDTRLKAVCSMNRAELSTVVELEILCQLAAREMGCTTSVIALINHDEYYGVASNVPELRGALVPRTQAMCAHTIMESQAPLLVPHPEADVRFSKFDSVDQYGVRFYCAFPLIGEGGEVVGSMCCVNSESLEIRESQLRAFKKLAATASKVMCLETQQRHRKVSAGDSPP